MNLDCVAQWYVARTHPYGEVKAAGHLSRQGFNVYIPRYLKPLRHARRVEVVPAPLFPRYLFVNVDMATQRWRSILSTIGITHLVSNGDKPAAVHREIIDELKRREDAAGFIRLDRRPNFRPGDRVRVLSGAFADSLGLFEDVTDFERVTILLELLGRKVRVRLDISSLVAA